MSLRLGRLFDDQKEEIKRLNKFPVSKVVPRKVDKPKKYRNISFNSLRQDFHSNDFLSLEDGREDREGK